MKYTRDGHRVDAYLDGGDLRGRLECPGPGRCTAQREGQPGACWLAVWFSQAQIEFFEWQEKPYVTCDLPVEIEWRTEGWNDDHELWWRPVVPGSEQESHEEGASR